MARVQKIRGRTRQVLCGQVRGGKWVQLPTTVHYGVECLLEELARGLPEEEEVRAALRDCRKLSYIDLPEGLRGKLEAEAAKRQGQTQDERDFVEEIKKARGVTSRGR